jgi:hypothetical protein
MKWEKVIRAKSMTVRMDIVLKLVLDIFDMMAYNIFNLKLNFILSML